ncbi:putative Ribosomal protein L7Ae L30e S12e Gadd45 family [Trypanosoma vivax]|uniref:40S ribosomal protein S12 n=1 Tax=Trypanosoma vivax (strain Y486) TaxID=1055687 RepID=G0UAW7_TRYVY|nr:putative 40S ribosomal protein S12 [Trypanosoma vivax]KAH8611959.1 putative Ribosomal protein L7Ae L30e S12e Gadd45 family [Trypanosoma vivax]CCC52954.1 putative 40S ribosomal protein S12 [Trypanosoma vivax Y486]
MAEEASMAVAEAHEPAVTDATLDAAPKSLEDALCTVLRKAREANGLIRGLSEVTRALDRHTAHLCVLADDCEDEDYKKLVKGLAQQGNIDLITVEEREKLAEWAGVVKFDADGKTRKAMKCSCVAVRDFGENTAALGYLLSHLK